MEGNNSLIDYAYDRIHEETTRNDLKKQSEEQRIDFLSHMVGKEDKKSGWQPSLADLGTESLNMIIAGADPFSSALVGVIFYLCHNQETLKKASTEVR